MKFHVFLWQFRSEGLTYAHGILYESTGLNGASSIRATNPQTGAILQSYSLDKSYFGEGLTYVDGKLFHLTYKKKIGFIFDANNFSLPAQKFQYETVTGEGWGLTYDPGRHELIVSDGSNFLLFWNATSTQELRRIEVFRMDGKKARNINELEWWRGRVLANVWFEDTILVIHPETGAVEKEYGT